LLTELAKGNTGHCAADVVIGIDDKPVVRTLKHRSTIAGRPHNTLPLTI
jgi:hypothetical protein